MEYKKFTDAISCTTKSSEQYHLPEKIRFLNQALLNAVASGKMNPPTQQLVYNEYGLPIINLQAIPNDPVNMYNSLDSVFNAIYHDLTEVDNRGVYAAILKCAGYKQIMKAKDYPLSMKDLSFDDLVNQVCLTVDFTCFKTTDFNCFKFDLTKLNIYIAFNGGNPYYGYSYETTVTEYDFDDSMPIHSIQLDSNINYTYFPDVNLHYQHY